MGIVFSFCEYSDVDNALDSIIVKSISFGDDEVKTPVRSVNFGSRDLEPVILKSLGSGKMMVERSVSFKSGELARMISFKASPLEKENDASTPISKDNKEMDNQLLKSDHGMGQIQKLPILDPNNPKHQAAIKLQKVYKSFRTRRKLADCAVLVEQSWWKLLDFAELKRSSISFFDIEKHETAISRWSRARTRAAKVGKGLSKNDKAQKLALQHWLEAIDPRHRYGHNLHFYYDTWLHSKSREPFFYWLDIGEGKEVNLEKCPRSRLQQQCIKYLGPMERMAYEVIVEDGRFVYKQTGEILHTTSDAKWIFVLSTSKILYVGKKKKGTFQHSSFLAGGVTITAGRLIIENGILKAVWPHSGHYRPTEENFKDFLSFLRENNVDLTDVKTSPIDEDEDSLYNPSSSKHFRSNSSGEDLSETINYLEYEEINAQDTTMESRVSTEEETFVASEQQKSMRLHNFSSKLPPLELPKWSKFEKAECEDLTIGPSGNNASADPQKEVGYESADDGSSTKQDSAVPKQNLLNDEQEGIEIDNISKEAILQRINSKKGTNSYQLGKQLSCKWTTGAGPRIGCVRDYPSELQFRALEKVNLSPRSIALSRINSVFNRKCCALTDSRGETAAMATSPMLATGNSLRESLYRTRTYPTQLLEGCQ